MDNPYKVAGNILSVVYPADYITRSKSMPDEIQTFGFHLAYVLYKGSRDGN